jgi:ABC-type branched-subunit amino acid transport system substrate-binding protein
VDVRIGVSQHPRELDVELADDTDRDALKQQITETLADAAGVLWLVDRRGREVAVPVAKIAYVEMGSPDAERRIGFGA